MLKIKEVRNQVKKYKELKADIVNIDIMIKEKEVECLGITAMPQGERTSPTYKITSTVELQAEKHQKEIEPLLHQKFLKENQIKRIDNALTILNEIERSIVETALIKGYRYSKLEEELHITYTRIKQIESDALNKMERYIRIN